MKISSRLYICILFCIIIQTSLIKINVRYYSPYYSNYPYTYYSYYLNPNNPNNIYSSVRTSSSLSNYSPRTNGGYSVINTNTNTNAGSNTGSYFSNFQPVNTPTTYNTYTTYTSESSDNTATDATNTNTNTNEASNNNSSDSALNKYSLQIYKNNQFGEYIVDGKNMTLYITTKDHVGRGYALTDFEISCYDSCARDFPPLFVRNENLPLVRGLDSTKLGKVKRKDGYWQITYNNAPLYYYNGDSGESDILAHGLEAHGGKWYMINPSGKIVRTL
jgi:predicted lipoprotein with Yx(FWY)xxD motif